MNAVLEIALLPVSIALCAFFAGFETGILSINRHRLVHLTRGGSRRAAYVARLLAQPRRLLATTLVGNNIAAVVAATLAANLGARVHGATGQALAAPAATVLVLVFGEYLPKVWCAAHPLRLVVPSAFVFRAFDFLLRPVAAACAFPARRLAAGGKAGLLPFVSRENIKILARDSQRQGNISPFERHLIHRVLELQLKQAWQLMTPLGEVVSVTPGQTLADCRVIALRSRHDRLPVFATPPRPGHSNQAPVCLGILQLTDAATRQAALDTPVGQLMSPARVVDMHMPADDLLPFMRANHTGILLLKDRAGVLRGLITQEDLLTALIDDLRQPSTDRVAVGGDVV